MSDQSNQSEFVSSTGEIIIGDHAEWIDFYTRQAYVDDFMKGVLHEMEVFAKDTEVFNSEIGAASARVHEDLGAADYVVNRMQEFNSNLSSIGDRMIEGGQRSKAIYDERDEREGRLATRIEVIPPATYVTRAIGEPKQPISKRYGQVRAEIEIFRQLTGESRETVSLGNGLEVSWAMSFLANLTYNIQKIQLMQILLSDDPMGTASYFGKQIVLERLGVPPRIADEEAAAMLDDPQPGTWLAIGLQICGEIEPAELGLAIDRQPEPETPES